MKKILISLAMIFAWVHGANLHAQPAGADYSGMFNVGMLYGSNPSKFQVQTIHGIAYRSWFVGIGGGIDDYFKQSIPLFLDVRKDILDRRNTPFIYADGGVNIVTKGSTDSYYKTKMKSGLFYEGGVGYKIGLSPKLAINIACGYSFKAYQQDLYHKKSLPTPPYQTDEWILSTHDEFSLNRFVMKAGLQF